MGVVVDYWPAFAQLAVDNVSSTFVTQEGIHVRQVFQDFPWMSPLYPSTWERHVDIYEFNAFAKDHQHCAWVAVAAYLCVVTLFKFKRGESDNKSLEQTQKTTNTKTNTGEQHIKTALAAWNLGLALFSLAGSLRMMPQLGANLWTYGFWFTILGDGEKNGGQGASGLWIMLFIYSKYIELFDTLFLILRRRPISFLHWYHHSTVLLYCWRMYADKSVIGIWFAAMNYVVHAVMYFYYFLTAVGRQPRWGKVVTVLQLAQMVAGIVLCALLGYVRFCVPTAYNYVSDGALFFGITIYASYFALFLSFFVRRYRNDTGSSTTTPPPKIKIL